MLMLITCLIINHALDGVFGKRKDGSTLLDYYDAPSLGLTDSRFFFDSGKYRLQGSRYYKKGLGRPRAVVVFFHGLGGGRTGYLHLISRIVDQGYLVYAFDNTGSNQGEGKSVVGLGHYFLDLKAFFSFLDNDEAAKGLCRYGIGHSWGGYAAMLSLHPDFNVERAVSLAGFVDPLSIISASANSRYLDKMSFLTDWILRRREGNTGNLNALDIAVSSNKPLLYIQGRDDPIVPFCKSGAIVETASRKHSKIETMFIEGRRHSCYLTDDAETAVEALWGVCRDITKAGKINTDLEKASEEDPTVLKRIFDFLSR